MLHFRFIRLAAYFFFILCAFPAMAQNTLSGVITDSENGQPLVHAGVYISDLQRGAVTDSAGQFSITGLPAGNYLLTANFAGYNSKNISVDIHGATTLTISLEQAHMEVQEIVVTGVSHATELKKSPVPTVVIGKDELAKSTGSNIIDAISKVPGITQLSTGGAVSKPIIRGLGYTRVITLYDGIRQEGQQWGDEHGVQVDQFSVERVEILKGPASFMYGSDALGGVINLLGPLPFPEGEKGGDVRLEYMTNNRGYAFTAGYGGNKNGINYLVRCTSRESGNYVNKYDGPVFNSGSFEGALTGNIGINRAWGYSHLSLSLDNQTIPIVEGLRDSASGRFIGPRYDEYGVLHMDVIPQETLTYGYSTELPYQQISHLRISSNNSFVAGKNRVSVNAGLQSNKRLEYTYLAKDPSSPEMALRLTSATIDAKYLLSAIKGWEPVIGFNSMYQVNEVAGAEFLIPAYHLFDAGIFAFAKKTFNKLDISGGIRTDMRTLSSDALYLKNDVRVSSPDSLSETKFSAFNRLFTNLSGSIGATYNLRKNLFLKANIARGFRAPNIAELSANGVHEGTFRYEIGNTDLKPETSLQEDLGLYLDSKHITVDLALFNNAISHFIYLEKLTNSVGGDSIIDPAEPSAAAYKFIQGKAQLYGGEAGIDIHPHPFDWLHFENTASLVYGLNRSAKTDDAKYLPFIPAATTRSELRGDFLRSSKKVWFKGVYVKVEAEHYFPQDRIYKVANTETATPGYTLINAGAGSSILRKNGKPFLDLTLTATNLADIAYQNHLSRLKYAGENPLTGRTGVYNMGRNFSFLLSFHF